MDSHVHGNKRAEYDRLLREACREIDAKVQHERDEMDRALKQEHAYVDMMLKDERADMSQKISRCVKSWKKS